MKQLLLLLFITAFIGGCSNPKSAVYDNEDFTEVENTVEETEREILVTAETYTIYVVEESTMEIWDLRKTNERNHDIRLRQSQKIAEELNNDPEITGTFIVLDFREEV